MVVAKQGAKGIWLLVLVAFALVWWQRRHPQPPAPATTRVLQWPSFERTPAAVAATREQTIAEADARLAQILAQPGEQRSFESTLVALDALEHEYARHSDRLVLLQNLGVDPEVRDAATEATVALERWYVENIELNAELYAVLEAFAETPEAAALTGPERLLLDDTLADFRRNGLLASPEDRAEIATLRGRLAQLCATIDRNIADDRGIVEFERDELEGLSDTQRLAFERDPLSGRYRVEAAVAPQRELVMRYATRRATRRATWTAAYGRARQANAEPIAEVISLRARLARLLGYETWADVRIEPNMARSVEVALGYTTELGEHAEPGFAAEQLALAEIARAELDDPSFGVDELGIEDVDYYDKLLREREYAIDSELVNQYFAEPGILQRIFAVAEQLFAIEIEAVEPGDAWAEDVQALRVSDADGGRLLGVIYLDLHPRPGKFTHFATFELVDGRRLTSTSYQAPITAIVGNFPVPVGDEPALWTLDDVATMLHELGHALHGVLTEADYFAQSGLDVPWDFVEVPSQLLERALEDPDVLRRLAAHYQTGEPMPEELIVRLVATARLGVAHSFTRVVARALVDFALHGYADPNLVPASGDELYALSNAILAEHDYAVLPQTAVLASFGHLFAGYDAGYYSYGWSDAIVADLLAKFRDSPQGFADAELGVRLREAIYAVGSSRPVDESIAAFLGRDWSPDALFGELAEP